MARVWTVLAAAGLAAGLILPAGCAAAPKAPTPGALFREYTRNTHVKGDVYPSMRTPADRLANLAAQGPPDAVEASLVGAYPCADNSSCNPGDQVFATLRRVLGPGTKTRYETGIDRLYQRLMLVKHASGQMELIRTYVASRPGGAAVLIDATGRTYRDLTDFQRNNNVLGPGDVVLTLTDVTAVPGKGRIVVVPGHTEPSPWPSAAVVIAVIVVAAAGAAGLVVWRRRMPHREAPETAPVDGAPDAYPNRPEM